MKRVILLPVLLFSVSVLQAQQNPRFQLTEHVFNAGGHPVDGVVMESARFRVTFDSVAEPIVAAALSSPRFSADAGLVVGYPPPGEVLQVRFNDKNTLEWAPERSVGHYNLYRDLLSSLSDTYYGVCHQHDLPSTTASDPLTPLSGAGYFYLVTAANRLREEGTLGRHSLGGERPNSSPCP